MGGCASLVQHGSLSSDPDDPDGKKFFNKERMIK